eukprot:gene4825-6013_t
MTESTKIVLITGCSSGIGLALARELKKQKSITVYASARKLKSIENLEKEGIKTVQLDFPFEKNAVNHIIKTEGRIDILINNAGMNYYSPAIEANPDDSARVMDTNFFGVVNTTIEVSKHMVERQSGTIVNVGSVVGTLSTPFTSMYCASKAATHAWTDSLRMELDPFNIKVITVYPGAVTSDIANNASAQLTQTMETTELYKPIKEYIEKRAQTSQINSTSAEDFAKHVVAKILSPNPPTKFAYGKLSTLFLILYYLPSWVHEFFFKNKFGIGKLKSYLVNQKKIN